MSSNPFELRHQVLQMSRDHLQNQYCMAREDLLSKWQAEKDTFYAEMEYAKDCKRPFDISAAPKFPDMPSYPTVEQVLFTASFFYNFVQDKHRGVLHLQVGDTNWKPTKEQLAEIAKLFQNADLEPKDGATQRVVTAARIICKGLDKDRPNILRDNLIKELSAAGINDSIIVRIVDKVFTEKTEPFLQTVLEKATDLLAKSVKDLNEIEKFSKVATSYKGASSVTIIPPTIPDIDYVQVKGTVASYKYKGERYLITDIKNLDSSFGEVKTTDSYPTNGDIIQFSSNDNVWVVVNSARSLQLGTIVWNKYNSEWNEWNGCYWILYKGLAPKR